MPSRTRATYSFIDQFRSAAACLSQAMTEYESRKETTGFPSRFGVFGMSCLVNQYVVQVNCRSATSSALETRLATSLDRWMDRVVSSQPRDAAYEASFEAAAGSAPPNRALGVLLFARRDRRAA